jgi:hypothetical protein
LASRLRYQDGWRALPPVGGHDGVPVAILAVDEGGYGEACPPAAGDRLAFVASVPLGRVAGLYRAALEGVRWT